MPVSVSEQFLEVFPRPFLATIPGILLMSYAEAERMALQFETPEAHDLRPIARRAFIEQSLRATARHHGLAADALPNDAGNCFHTFVECAPFTLTESVVTSPEVVVRRAVFRDAYSRRNLELDLFVDDREPAVMDRPEKLYGIILHGPHPKEPSRPGFAWVRFPHPGFDAYYPEHVDLQRLAAGKTIAPEIPQSEVQDNVGVEIAEHLRKLREQSEG